MITSFNRLYCIERAINSALTEFPGHEVVVIDDASTDGTQLMLSNRYSNEISSGQLILKCLHKNLGVTGAKNYGFVTAKADWVFFLDSDDYYVQGSGYLMFAELRTSDAFPIVFFRCRTQDGVFIGKYEGFRILLDLRTYLQFTSFGEALTAINKLMVGDKPPYVDYLRGYEGIGCARLISSFGPALLSEKCTRIYVLGEGGQLSCGKIFNSRLRDIANGHLLLINEFGAHINLLHKLSLFIKAMYYHLKYKLNSY